MSVRKSEEVEPWTSIIGQSDDELIHQVRQAISSCTPDVRCRLFTKLLSELDDDELSATISTAISSRQRLQSAQLQMELQSLTSVSAHEGKSSFCARATMESQGWGRKVGISSSHALESQGWVEGDDTSDGALMTGPMTNLMRAINFPRVQFASDKVYFVDTVGTAVIQVLRVGPLTETSKASWRTENNSAESGMHFVSACGVLTFKPGETIKSIEVEIIHRARWERVVEFHVRILEEGLENLELGRVLNVLRVRVINTEPFPSHAVKLGMASEEELERNRMVKPVLEYFRVNLQHPVVRRGFCKMVCIGQLHNLNLLLVSFIDVYLIDYIVNPKVLDKDEVVFGDKGLALAAVAACKVIPFIILWWLDTKTKYWKVGGTTRARIQINMLAKYLFCEEDFLEKMGTDLSLAMTRDTEIVAHDGFMKLLNLSQSVGKICTVFIFNILSAFLFRKYGALMLVVIVFFVMPMVLLLFLSFRETKGERIRVAKHHAQNAMIRHVDDTVKYNRVIVEYHQGTRRVQEYEQLVGAYNRARVLDSVFIGNNITFSSAVSMLVITTWIVVGGIQVINNNPDVPLGIFLSTLNMLSKLGDGWASVYGVFVSIQSTLPSMRRITFYMNLDNRTTRLRQVFERRVNYTLEKIGNTQQKYKDSNELLDRVPLHISALGFSYGADLSSTLNLSVDIAFEIPQGHLTLVVGSQRAGKRTFMKLLANTLDTCEGIGVTIPSYLRVIQVGCDPVLFEGKTLMENLIYGSQAGSVEVAERRVLAICKRFGLNERVLNFVVDMNKVLTWRRALSRTEVHSIYLARALILNPQVLLIHEPCRLHDETESMRIMNLLRDHVENKGIEHERHLEWLRRPRTCLISTNKKLCLEAADSAIHVKDNGEVHHWVPPSSRKHSTLEV